MEKISKIKEWVLINYRKIDIFKMFDSKLEQMEIDYTDTMEYYNKFDNPFECQIIDEITLNIDEKFNLNEEEMKKITFFIEKYVKMIIPTSCENSKRNVNKKIIYNIINSNKKKNMNSEQIKNIPIVENFIN